MVGDPSEFKVDSEAMIGLLGTDCRIAVVIPCHNEEKTVATVVRAFREQLPYALIVVADNASSDDTATIAAAAGATVLHEGRKGKGHAVNRLFAEVEADCFVMVDGDDTYDASVVREMCQKVVYEGVDMVCATRSVAGPVDRGKEFRRGHEIGNRMFSFAFSSLFRMPMTDVFSGYRVMSRRFVKSFLGSPGGFDIEIELNAHCVAVSASYAEIEADYGSRPIDSESKLRTYRDGLHIGRSLLRLFRDLRPSAAFALLALPCALIALALGLYAVIPYLDSGYVLRFPSLIASLAFLQAVIILLMVGFLSGRIAENRCEVRRAVYLREGISRRAP